MSYAVKTGVDQPLIDLVAIDPQPRCSGLRYARTGHTAAGGMILESPWVELEWDVIESQSQYEDLLEQFGLDLATDEDVTVTLPNELFTVTRFNGKCLRPVVGETVSRESYFIRDVRIIVKNLAVSS